MNRNITAPLSDEVAKELKSGDYVYITGTIYTARDAAHKRMWEALEKGEELPIEMKNNIKTKELLELKNAVNQMAYNLKNQEMLRKRLVTDVAHELRTPLTNVMSHIELMADEIWEASPERLEICSSELGRISEIIKNLEKLQQIENENMDLCCENVDLIDLIEQCNKAFESKMKEKDISCTVEGESTIACVDISKFTQVLHNLLSNSIKYTENGGKIYGKCTKREIIRS